MLKNNLISMLNQTFPGVNELFKSPPRKSDGHEKWLDFAAEFWHAESVCGLSKKRFIQKYRKWCKVHGYRFSTAKAEDVYTSAAGHVYIMPATETTRLLITQAVTQP